IWYYKQLPAGQASKFTRLIYSPLIGLAMLYFCYGSAMKHLLANAGICYVLMLFSPTRYVHKLVFVAAMGYLSFIHMYRWWILTSYYIDITGPMMVLVQKTTTIAFSLHDGKMKKKEELNAIQKKEAIAEVPSILEYVSFVFHFQAVLTGPLCFFSDYMDFIEGRHVTPKSAAARPKMGNNNDDDVPTPWATVTEKLMWSLVFLGVSVVIAPQFQPEIMLQTGMMSQSFFTWYLTLIFVMMLQRVQYYFVWMFADAICNASGLGFAGYDEHGKPKWDLVSSVNPYKVEMATNFKDTLDAWNCTTMYWLRRVAYDRAPPQFRTVYTYLLSAWWHGFFPGYYLTFLTGALFTVAGRTVSYTSILII
uniref:Lysophospholipid acyltransferase 1 n=1 Tax=Plectus sambesii TaxID=2011161 RepID=A0A914XMX9_9BILA